MQAIQIGTAIRVFQCGRRIALDVVCIFEFGKGLRTRILRNFFRLYYKPCVGVQKKKEAPLIFFPSLSLPPVQPLRRWSSSIEPLCANSKQ